MKTPKHDEQTRKKMAEQKRLQRAKAVEAEEAWHLANRSYLEKRDPAEYQRLLALQEVCKDQLWWLLRGHTVDPSDPDYVSLEEGIADLGDFVQTNDLFHGGYIPTPLAPNGRGCFYWDAADKYWQHQALMNFLCSLSKPTELYAKYGIIGIPDWRYKQFKEDVTNERGELDETLWRSLPVSNLEEYMENKNVNG